MSTDAASIGIEPAVARIEAAGPFDALLQSHWPGLVRLATVLLRDAELAEDVVQDAVVSCLTRTNRLRDDDAALAYLRRSVVNGARSALRRRRVAASYLATIARHPPDHPPADEGALGALDRNAVITALGRLPARQREAVTLRFYADLTERQTAAAMGIAVGTVKSATSRGLATLQELLKGIR